MGLLERLRLLLHIIRWRLTWSKKDLDFRPKTPVSAKFITAREAAQLIPDGATVFSNGLAGNARCSVFYWALRDLFQKTGHPRDLTWVNVGAQGGRGKVPGTLEEIGLPGLMRLYMAGHLETCKAQLQLAEKGQLELHTLPQGVMSLLLEAQAQGKTNLNSPVGIGTFLDPRVGKGSALTPGAGAQYVAAEDDTLLYHLPRINVALFNAPYADAEGNIYFTNAATWTENIQSAAAARANGGKVFVTVSAVILKDEANINLRTEAVDYIVVHPYNEQTASIRQHRYWPMFTAGASVDVQAASLQLRFINNVLKITPVRGAVEFALARLGARVFAESVAEGAMVNIGVGFPEEVARQLVEHGVSGQLLFTTEAGAYGGLPAPGIFFSAAIGPQHLEPSSVMFHRYQSELDVAVLGFLQVDSAGNVNASHRGPRMTDMVGPGGFPDIATGAHTLIFVGTWMAGARFALRDHRLVIEKPGACKFVDRVSHITFSGREALRMGKKVFYVTNVGVFALKPKGLELREVMPGIDVERDILNVCSAHIHLPENGQVSIVDTAVVDGGDFSLHLQQRTAAGKLKNVTA
jgi:propionate CoA-transferase